MKTLFIFRNSFESKYILTRLSKKGLLGAVIIEGGKKARREKLKRVFKKENFFLLPKLILDIIALLFYNRFLTDQISKRLGEYNYPENKVKLLVDDVNEKKCLDFIKIYKPEVVFIYGTAILKKALIKMVEAPILNIHSGIVPYYRNVHSDFWALKNKDFKNIGVSILYVDDGIDSGDIFLQRAINYKKGEGLTDVKIRILKLIVELTKEALKKIKNKKTIKEKQDSKKSGFYKTPGLVDLIRFCIIPR